MGRKKSADPIGPVLEQNLIRLGYCRTVVNAAEIARRVGARTGRKLSRQRVSQMLNAVHLNAATIAMLAEGLGVDPAELTRRPKR